LQYLHESFWFKSFHLHLAPHLLTGDLWEKWKEYARAILPFLYAAERDDWHRLMTGDESWFFFDTSPRRMWTLPRDDVVTKPRQQIQSKKFMFTIIWNPTGFYVFDRFPNDTKMNSDYFVTNAYFSQINDLSLKKGTEWKTTGDFCWQLLCSHKSGFNRLARKTWHSPHARPTLFI
jgi:hypothetical protein